MAFYTEYGLNPEDTEGYLPFPTFEAIAHHARERLIVKLASEFESPSRITYADVLTYDVVMESISEVDPSDDHMLFRQAIEYILAKDWENLADEAANRKADLVSELPF